MRTLGIDLASQPGNTGVAGIDWPESAPPRLIPFAELEERPFTDACLVEILRTERWGRVAIDVPFGWPRNLLDLLGRWRAGEPVNLPMDERRGRSETLYRRTDLVTWDRTGVKPIPVGVESLGWVALRAFHVLSEAGFRHALAGRGPSIIETYPKAALTCWPGMPLESTKSGDAAPRARAEVLARLADDVPLTMEDVDRRAILDQKQDHRFDALICALVARAAMVGRTHLPAEADMDAAREEGWIHVPIRGSLTSLADAGYLEVQIPDGFILETLEDDGSWLEWGVYRREQFQRLPNGSYVCSGHGGSPTWIRCVRREDEQLHVIDGGGRPFTYRLRSVE